MEECAFGAYVKFEDLAESHWVGLDLYKSYQHEDAWCWIYYKGRVAEAWYDAERQVFRHSRIGNGGLFLTECVKAVYPWETPAKPSEDIF